MGVMDEIKNLEDDPRFAKLSYSDQMFLRTQKTGEILTKDPKFLALSVDDQKYLTQNLTVRPPVLEAYPTGMMARLKDYSLSQLRKMGGVEQTLKEIDTQAFEYGMTLAEGAGFTKDALMGFFDLGINLVNWIAGKEVATPYAKTWRDAMKVKEYLRIVRSADAELALSDSIITTAGTITGMAGELNLFYGTMVGSFKAPVGVTKALMGGVDKLLLGRAPHMLYTGARALTHAVGGGLVGMLRETSKDLLEGKMNDPNFANLALKSMSYFKDYALGDLACFAVGGLIKRTGGAMSWTFSGPKGMTKRGLWENLKLTFNDSFADAILGKEINPILIEKYGDEGMRAIFNSTQAFGRVLRNVEAPALDDVIRATSAANATSLGFVMDKMGDTWKAFDVDGKVVGKFSTPEDALEFMSVQIKKLPSVDVKDVQALGTASGKMVLTQSLKKYLPKDAEGETLRLLSSTIAPVGGRFNTDRVRVFTQEFLKSGGVDAAVTGSVKVLQVGDNIRISVRGQDVFNLPLLVSTAKTELSAIDDLTRKLSEFIPEAAVAKNASKNLLDTYQEMIAKSTVHYTPSWVLDTVTNDFNGKIKQVPGGGFELRIGEDPVQTFKDFQDMGSYVVQRKIIDEKSFSSYLATYEGARLVKPKQGGIQIWRKDKMLAGGNNIDDIFKTHPEFTPKIPSEFGPQFTFISDEAPGVLYNQKIAVGNAQTLMEELSKFKNYSEDVNKTSILGGRMTFDRASKEFEVFMPELNYRETFKNRNDAMKFLQKSSDDWDVIQHAAWGKGYQVDVFNNQWRAYTEGHTYVARTRDDLKKIIQEAPMPSWVPELSGIEKEFYAHLDKIPNFGSHDRYYQLPKDYMPAEMGPGWVAANWLRPMDAQLETALKKGAPEFMQTLFNRIETGRGITAQTTAKACGLVDQVLKINGKTIKRSVREKIGSLLENDLDGAGIDDILKGMGLDHTHLEIAKNLRGVFDDLAKYYQINPDRFVRHYLPRMREYVSGADAGKFFDSDIDQFLKSAFKEDIPDLKAFFKHARTNDVVQFVQEKDPLTLIRKYIAIGQRERYMGPHVEEAIKYLNLNRGKIDQALSDRFLAYMQDFVGLPSSITDKMVTTFSKRLFHKLGFKGSGTFIDSLIKYSYSASMTWRPNLALRNLTQPLVTLGWRIDNQWIFKAMGQVVDDVDGTLYQSLIKRGVLQTDFPFYASGSILGKGGGVEKFTRAGLTWFKNADAYNRAVSYLACTAKFDYALLRMRKGFIKNLDDFVMESGLWNLDATLLKTANAHMKSGAFEKARELFASTLTDETQFIYREGRGSMLFRGSLGKLFGQYGTFKLNYVDNIRKTWSRVGNLPNTLQKGELFSKRFLAQSGLITRFFANATALATAGTYLGMKADDFFQTPIPLTAGGPYWQMMQNMLQSLSPGYQGRQARAQMFGVKEKDGKLSIDLNALVNSNLIQGTIPGSYAFKSMLAGAGYLNKGDIYRAMLAFTGAPASTYQQ